MRVKGEKEPARERGEGRCSFSVVLLLRSKTVSDSRVREGGVRFQRLAQSGDGAVIDRPPSHLYFDFKMDRPLL